VHNVHIFDARSTPIRQLPGHYDLIYSFFCIGFHWSLEHFMPDILSLMNERSLAIFTVPLEFEPFSGLSDVSFKLIDLKTVWPKDGHLKFLILSKTSGGDNSSERTADSQ
jgi:hypothetical protein